MRIVILGLMLLPAMAWAQVYKAPAQTAPAPKSSKERQVITAPRAATMLQAPTTGAMKCEVINADFKLVGATDLPEGLGPDTRYANGVGPGDSALFITGRIAINEEYKFALPIFPTPHLVFTDAPKDCQILNGLFEQNAAMKWRYRYFYIFKDTATKAECWKYFTGLKTLNVNITKAGLKTVSVWEPLRDREIQQPGVRSYQISGVKVKGQYDQKHAP